MAESYLSLQFVPPIVIARMARLLHISTARAFIAVTAITAFTSALAIFWLLASIIEGNRTAAVGVLVVLFAGSANLVVEHLLGFADSNNYLPFLRRYLPAFSFPILFAYCAITWRVLMAEGKRIAPLYALSAGALFAVLTFHMCITGPLRLFGPVVWLRSGSSRARTNEDHTKHACDFGDLRSCLPGSLFSTGFETGRYDS